MISVTDYQLILTEYERFGALSASPALLRIFDVVTRALAWINQGFDGGIVYPFQLYLISVGNFPTLKPNDCVPDRKYQHSYVVMICVLALLA